jgi:hypothetical protein
MFEERVIKFEHNCGYSCPKCYGSGEGMYDGSRGCTECRGRGFFGPGEVEVEVEVEIEDGKLIGSYECGQCGQDMREEIEEEIKCQEED